MVKKRRAVQLLFSGYDDFFLDKGLGGVVKLIHEIGEKGGMRI